MQQMAEILNSLAAGFIIIDREHRVEWMNKKAMEWLGPFVEIGERRRCYRTIVYSEGFCEICPTGRTIDHGTASHYEFNLPSNTSSQISRNNKPVAFEIIGIPIFDRNRRVSRVVELILDVTEKGIEKIKSEELMAHIEKMAAIGQLAAGVAHELNNPLATISIISEELTSLMDGFTEGRLSVKDMKDYLSDISSEIKRCQTIIGDLLNFSKKGVSEQIMTDLNNLVSKAINLIQKGEGYQGVAILKDFDTSLPVVKTDSERFKQVVFNVLKNAVEAVIGKEDGRVVVSTLKDGCSVKVVVSDNGSGIPAENLKKVFEPFFTTKPVGKGTGLGLSVSYGIMKDLLGDIKIDSRGGEGTIISLLLPME
ncbi:MAG: hypothetical protein HY026_00300 [Deltaproteobacteria bacterium]|nr:hypothetical protein [Deltaproteobacteria bacterium]